jgi:hypothetical protein
MTRVAEGMPTLPPLPCDMYRAFAALVASHNMVLKDLTVGKVELAALKRGQEAVSERIDGIVDNLYDHDERILDQGIEAKKHHADSACEHGEFSRASCFFGTND